MRYEFKVTPELIWALVVAAATAALQFIASSAQPTDIGVWLVALGAAAVRAVVGAIIDATTAGGRL